MSRRVRVRTGCWTCRFRKKKCDEAHPTCDNCRNLNLDCDGYTGEPAWMKDPVEAQQKKEQIRVQMSRCTRKRRSRTKKVKQEDDPESPSALAERLELRMAAQNPSPIASLDHSRLPSPSPLSQPALIMPMDDDEYMGLNSLFLDEGRELGTMAVPHPDAGSITQFPARKSSTDTNSSFKSCDSNIEMGASPDVIPRNSTVPAAFQIPVTSSIVNVGLISLSDSFFKSLVQIDSPRHLEYLKFYIGNLPRLVYPACSIPKLTSIMQNNVLPLLQRNKGYREAIIGCGALQMGVKYATHTSDGQSDHLQLQIRTEAFECNTRSLQWMHHTIEKQDHEPIYSLQLLASILGAVSFDIFASTSLWQVHVTAASKIVAKMWENLPELLDPPTSAATGNFAAVLFKRFIWVDIISSLSSGRCPTFMAQYRRCLQQINNSSSRSMGLLADLCGVEDATMLTISEISVLEAWKEQCLAEYGSVDMNRLVERGQQLNTVLVASESKPPSPIDSPADSPLSHANETNFANVSSAFQPMMDLRHFGLPSRHSSLATINTQASWSSVDSAVSTTFSSPANSAILDPQSALSQALPSCDFRAVNDAFRVTARLHLFCIMFGPNPTHDTVQKLVDRLIEFLRLIPAGSDGFDRTVTYPLLLGGVLSILPHHRAYFRTRLNFLSRYGMHENVEKIVLQTWAEADVVANALRDGSYFGGVGVAGQHHMPWPHWRVVMNQNDWHCILL